MKTIIFLIMGAAALLHLLVRSLKRPSGSTFSVDVIVPAFNEEPIIRQSLISLLRNPYVKRVICVNDGSTDQTAKIAAELEQQSGGRLMLVDQPNTGKGGAIMHGLQF